MIVAAHQPNYLSYTGFFNKIAKCDAFILMDDVAFTRRDFTHRNKIRTAQGWMWLTVPFKHAPLGTSIKDIEINGNGWNKHHWECIRHMYRRAECFSEYAEDLESFYSMNFDKLAELNISLIKWLLEKLGINTILLKQSEMDIKQGLKKSDLLIEMVKKAGGDTYLSGVGAVDYVDRDKFHASGIELVFQDFKHPTYKQVYEPFIQNMSIIDLLLCCGEESGKIVREC